jgi:hypothetical protein
MRTPRGPQPPSVYWRRRLIVLLGAAVIIAVIVLIFVRPASDAPLPVGTVAPDTSAAQSQPSAASDQPGVCQAGQVTVSAVTDSDSYGADIDPQLSWTLVNTSDQPCTLNVGTAQQVFTVTSGAETIWSSKDCQKDAADYPLTIEPESSGAKPTVSSTITWDRERSSADSCDTTDKPKVTAGGASYHLQVTVGGISSTDTEQFILN